MLCDVFNKICQETSDYIEKKEDTYEMLSTLSRSSKSKKSNLDEEEQKEYQEALKTSSNEKFFDMQATQANKKLSMDILRMVTVKSVN